MVWYCCKTLLHNPPIDKLYKHQSHTYLNTHAHIEDRSKCKRRLLPSRNEVLLSLGGVLGCVGEAASPQVRSKVPKEMNVFNFVMFSNMIKTKLNSDKEKERLLQFGMTQGRNLR